MNYIIRESAVMWLKDRGFQDAEVDELRRVLNVVGFKKQEDLVILPKNTSKRIAAIVYLLNLVTDPEGNPVCCDKNGLIKIPEEAKQFYEDELELEDIARPVMEKLMKRNQVSSRTDDIFPKKEGHRKK